MKTTFFTQTSTENHPYQLENHGMKYVWNQRSQVLAKSQLCKEDLVSKDSYLMPVMLTLFCTVFDISITFLKKFFIILDIPVF